MRLLYTCPTSAELGRPPPPPHAPVAPPYRFSLIFLDFGRAVLAMQGVKSFASFKHWRGMASITWVPKEKLRDPQPASQVSETETEGGAEDLGKAV